MNRLLDLTPDEAIRRNCPACGSFTQHHSDFHSVKEFERGTCHLTMSDHIHVTCKRCGYGWGVKPLYDR